MANTFTVGQVAERLAVTYPTVRNWAKRYASHLSSSANPPSGEERFFTERDINVLSYVGQCVAEKMRHDAIEDKLASTHFGDTLENNTQEASNDDIRSNTSTDAPIVVSSPSSVVEFPPAVTELIVNRLDNVSDRLTALEARRTAAQWFAIGATVGGGLVVAGLLIAWLLLRGG